MSAEAAAGGGVEAAARRLDEALARLARRLGAVDLQAGARAAGERDRLAAELDGARGRERMLEAMASEASAALGRAADEVRAALQAEAEPAAGEGSDENMDEDELVLVLTDPAPDPKPGGAR